mmetsp:Transcript_30339/g.97002  ORF Transcript_30339/g.97002 Transcript_30339/m.97002 type:complete len:245 (-) Transcript_30339:100-834(-)
MRERPGLRPHGGEGCHGCPTDDRVVVAEALAEFRSVLGAGGAHLREIHHGICFEVLVGGGEVLCNRRGLGLGSFPQAAQRRARRTLHLWKLVVQAVDDLCQEGACLQQSEGPHCICAHCLCLMLGERDQGLCMVHSRLPHKPQGLASGNDDAHLVCVQQAGHAVRKPAALFAKLPECYQGLCLHHLGGVAELPGNLIGNVQVYRPGLSQAAELLERLQPHALIGVREFLQDLFTAHAVVLFGHG